MSPEKIHERFFGSKQPPTEAQKKLYGQSGVHGVSSKTRDADNTDAILMIALGMALNGDGSNFHRVFILTPASEKGWVIERIRNAAMVLTKRVEILLKDPDEGKRKKGQAAMEHVRKWIGGLQLGSPVDWGSFEKPERWVSIGYAKDDAVPGWVRDGLAE